MVGYFKVRNYQKANRKYALEFLDQNSTKIPVSEKNVVAFSKEPTFLIPDEHKASWNKYQAIACKIFGNYYESMFGLSML